MPKYAAYDPAIPAPSPVTGWYDTDVFTYRWLPPSEQLVLLTDAQWVSHFGPGLFGVTDGVLVSRAVPSMPPPLPPSPLDLSQQALAERLANGIAVVSAEAPQVDGIYALDQVSTGQIFQIGLYAKQFGTFPSGGEEQMYPDIIGEFHLFPVSVFVAFLQAVAVHTSALNMQQALMAQGGAPAWPDNVYALL